MGRMLSVLLLFLAAQVPAVPGETTLVSSCKQRILSACEALRQVNPGKAAEIEQAAASAALRLETLRAAEEEAQEEKDSEATQAEGDAAPEPPECKGQNHHVISRPIARKLRIHQTLRGLYEPRDERFKARAKDEESHCGYQTWHREVDAEVIEWLERHARATPKQFEQYLREIYSRPEMLKRFPNGF
jgi:hypothetical protein